MKAARILPAALSFAAVTCPSNVFAGDVSEVGRVTSRNLFAEYLGQDNAALDAKIDAAWAQLFQGDDATQRVYYPVGDDMAYIYAVDSHDVR
ncbi:MAG TPA: glycoside hydrolase, partial [Opitutales bacterium]|nr:glycoside hydrolase [Opitutales bacterium]